MLTGLVDFHCHLDLYPDPPAAIAECERLGIYTLTVTTTPKAWPQNQKMAQGTRYVRVALGLHPQLVAERADELALWKKYFPQARYIGEVGLDASPRFYRSLDQQKLVFERILQSCGKGKEKVLSVHSTRAVTAVLDMIESHLPSASRRVVLHWFTGSSAEARRAAKVGCYFSVNNEMLQKDRHRSIVAALPLDRILTETDGPFTRRDGRPAKPSDISFTVEELARVRGSETSEIAAAIRTNLRRLLSE